MDFLPQWASDLSGWGAFVTAVLWFLWLVLTGRLVPRRYLDDANTRGDKYMKAWEISMEDRRERDGQKTELAVENSSFAARVMEAIQTQAKAIPKDTEGSP